MEQLTNRVTMIRHVTRYMKRVKYTTSCFTRIDIRGPYKKIDVFYTTPLVLCFLSRVINHKQYISLIYLVHILICIATFVKYLSSIVVSHQSDITDGLPLRLYDIFSHTRNIICGRH